MSMAKVSRENCGIPEEEIVSYEEHGDHIVVTTDDYIYAIPKEIDETTNATLVIHGDGGLPYMLNGSQGIYSYLDENNVNSVLVMPNISNNESNAEGFVTTVNTIAENLNLQNEERAIIGYSNGCYAIDEAAEAFIDTNENLPPLRMVYIDPDTAYMHSPSDETAAAIGENGASIMVFEKEGELSGPYNRQNEFYKYYGKYAGEGVSTAFVGGSSDHGYEFYDAVSDGLLNAVEGGSASEQYTASLLTSRDTNGRSVIGIEGNSYTNLNIDDYASSFASSNSTPVFQSAPPLTFDNPINMDLAKQLAGMEALTISDSLRQKLSASPKGVEVLSDLEYVIASMNRIRTFAKNIASSASISSSFTSNLLAKAINAIQRYYAYLVNLMESLSNETVAIDSIAEGIADMDSFFETQTPSTPTPEVTSGNIGQPEVSSAESSTATPNDVPSLTSTNPNVTTNKYEDGSYQIRSTNPQDGSTIEVNYDSQGNVLSRITRDVNGNIVETIAYAGSALAGTDLVSQTGSESYGATEQSQSNTVTPAQNSENDNQHTAEVIQESTSEQEVYTQNIDKTGSAIRPAAPDGTTPVEYARFKKSVDGNEVTYRYYDKDGNVIGETVTNGGKVSSSYYEYIDENGNKVTVNYDPSGANVEEEQAAPIEVDNSSSKAVIETQEQTQKQAEEDAVKRLALELAREEATNDPDFEYTEAEINELAEEKYKWLQSGGWREYEDRLNGMTQEELQNSAEQSIASDTTTVTESPVVEEQQPVEEPEVVVEEPEVTTTGGNADNDTNDGGKRTSSGGGSYGGGSSPTRTPSTPVYTEPTKQPVEDKKPTETVKPVEEVKPTQNNTHTDSTPKIYNYYSSPTRETSIPKVEVEKPVIDDIIDEPIKELPDEEEPIISPIKVNESNKRAGNAGKVLGTIAGIAAAGAGMAGLAYGTNKLMNEKDEEESDDEYSRDDNDEIDLSDRI